MLLLNKTSSLDTMVVTLFEKRVNFEYAYLFIFKNVTTRSLVTFVKSDDDDISTATDRYNEFEIDTSDIFSGKQEGQWQYNIYETDGATDYTEGMNLLETGKMLLQGTEARTVKAHSPQTNYKGYAG